MADADERKAGAIILKDIALFNKAAVFFETQIDPLIRSEIEQVVADWLKAHGWGGKSDITKSRGFDYLWVAPPHWQAEKDDWCAWFSFSRRADIDSRSYEIADLFGAGESEGGFRFSVGYGWFGGKPAWNTYAKGLGDLGQQLSERGWKHEGKGVFFRPVKLSAELLAPSWESEDWAEALAPLEKALDALASDIAIFDTIIEGAKIKAIDQAKEE
jgi:hypothetical protein